MSDYYTLITALPWLPDLDQCKQLPLSRIALEQRLTMLSEQDRQQLLRVESLYHPSDPALNELTDRALVSAWQAQLELVQSQPLRECVLYQMELRTLLAALRSRSSGLENPMHFFGLGRWLPRIRKHWFEPAFGLEDVYPPVKELQRLLSKDNPMLVERYLSQLLWRDLSHTEHEHHFTFETLACFVLRWGIAEQYIQHDGVLALERFNHSAAALLASTDLELQLAQGVR